MVGDISCLGVKTVQGLPYRLHFRAVEASLFAYTIVREDKASCAGTIIDVLLHH
jgi:hypothetical protein